MMFSSWPCNGEPALDPFWPVLRHPGSPLIKSTLVCRSKEYQAPSSRGLGGFCGLQDQFVSDTCLSNLACPLHRILYKNIYAQDLEVLLGSGVYLGWCLQV